jgi:hypothetical protein
MCHEMSSLLCLYDLAAAIDSHGRNRRARVQELRAFYEGAIKDFNGLMSQLPGRSLPESLRKRWLDHAYKVLKKYAEV